MKNYNLAERTIAKALEAFPGLKKASKKTYQRINYWYYNEKGFRVDIHPAVRLLKPEEWAQVHTGTRELFFGYYDKSPWSPSMDHLVLHQLNDNGEMDIIVYDKKNNSYQIVAHTTTWNFQQGAMVQCVPESKGRCLIFNDVVDNLLSARILTFDNYNNINQKTISWPIQTLHPNGKTALTLNYKRLDNIRPEYGYSNSVINFSEDQTLDNDGIWQVDLDSGTGSLIVTLAQLREYVSREEMSNAQHKVNHILYSPTGKRFVFLHRWIGSRGKFSRLYVANENGRHLKLLLDDRMVSHYHWKDDDHLIVWGRMDNVGDRYYLINVTNRKWEIIGDGVLNVFGDGHPSYSPDRQWILTDTYPDKSRQRQLLLYHLEEKNVIILGRFLAPLKFDDAYRCDLHPRWSPDGKWISIDSAHEGIRYSYLLDVSAIVGRG